ncbi:hypothetical protein GGI21_003534 [Coemansia aciculifera]|nr:hypothetical protein GGI21_003534 [Coemansia aciculifera]
MPPPTTTSIKKEPRRSVVQQVQPLAMLVPQSTPSILPSANMPLPLGNANHGPSLPPSSDRASLFSSSLSQRSSSVNVPGPIIVATPNNMPHLLVRQGGMPLNHQEYAYNSAIGGPPLSPLAPLSPMASHPGCQIQQFSSASVPMPMATGMYSAAPLSAGYQTIAAASNLGSVEMTGLPCTSPRPNDFSVADIYMPPVSSFGSCANSLDSTVGAPTPLFMNANSFGINPSPLLLATNPWPAGMSSDTAMDISTSMAEQLQALSVGLPPKPF